MSTWNKKLQLGCRLTRKAWFLKSGFPLWLHYPLFQVVQALSTVFSWLCAPTWLQRYIYAHITTNHPVSRYTAQRREARKGTRHGVHICSPGTQEAVAEETRIQGQHELQHKAQKQKVETRERDQRLANPLPLPTKKNSYIWSLLPLPSPYSTKERWSGV